MLTKRQEFILNQIQKFQTLHIAEIERLISKTLLENISRPTLIRELNVLIKRSLITRNGKGKSTKYIAVYQNPILHFFDKDTYFATENRTIKRYFDFEIFKNLNGIFSLDEIAELQKLNKTFQANLKIFPKNVIHKEFERITVEFSWKSSQIEGNTYSLLDTERLIKEKVQANGHSQEEATMIFNHKQAMDFILQNPDYFNEISVSKIEDIHRIITNELDVCSGIRKTPVGIIGTDYKPLDNQFQIREAFEATCDCVNSANFALEKALIAIAMISYIQPFEDGNKRTARVIGNALLLASAFCLLSYKSVDEVEYKKSMIIFYEQNSIHCFKQLFIEQFKIAISKYF